MKKIISTMIALVITMSLVGIAAAQESTASGTRTPRVAKRQKHQQKRIGQGIHSGELTRREALRLEHEQREIRQEKREAKADGEVTRHERVGLRREQNQASRHVYRAKNNRRDRN